MQEQPFEARQPGFAEDAAAPPVMEFLSSGEGLQLSLAFMRIKDAKVRKRVLDLVKARWPIPPKARAE